MLKSVDVSDYMLENPIKVAATDDIFTAIDVITESRVSGVCVVDADNRLLGVLSEMDCLRATLSAIYNETASVGRVDAFMTSEVTTCNLHDDVVNVASDMLKQGHRRRPVVHEGKLVGQITCRQLLRVVRQFNRSKPAHSG